MITMPSGTRKNGRFSVLKKFRISVTPSARARGAGVLEVQGTFFFSEIKGRD